MVGTCTQPVRPSMRHQSDPATRGDPEKHRVCVVDFASYKIPQNLQKQFTKPSYKINKIYKTFTKSSKCL